MTTTPKTPAEEIAECRTEIVAKIAAFRAAHAGRILDVTTETRSVWLDGGEYYDVLSADVWTGSAIEHVTVCTDGAARWHGAGGYDLFRPLVADATPAVIAAAQAWTDAEEAYAARCKQGHATLGGGDVASGALVIVTRGTKVPQGTVAVVTWCGTSAYGGRARLSPIDEHCVAVVRGREGGGDTYTAVANVTVLMTPDEARPDWRAPVTDLCARRYPVAALAWTWASRDAAHSTLAELGARHDFDAEPLRALDARARWAVYADRLAADPLAAEVAALFAECPPVVTGTKTPRTLAAVFDDLNADRPTVENALTYAEGDRATYLRVALGAVGLAAPVAAPVKTRAKRARKAATAA